MTLTTQPEFYLFKDNNKNTKNTRARCEMCLNEQDVKSGVSIGDFEQVNAGSVDEL